MRKVTRPPEPEILRNNKDQWTQELLEQIQNNKGDYTKVADKYKNRYRQDEIKEVLQSMYSGLCCFCESEIGISDYEHIEHLRPKSKFPELSFDWKNLNWCCSICNNKKRSQWNNQNPILDPSVDEPSEHLYYYRGTIEHKSDRGQTTIEHVDLNRPKLVEARKKTYARAIDLINTIKSTNDPATADYLRRYLSILAKDGEKYCSLVRFIIDTYLD